MEQVFLQILWQILFLVKAPAFWLMAGVVYLQVRRRAKQKEEMFQMKREPVLPVVVKILLAGLAGGIIASVLLVSLGVSVERIGLKWLWITALLLMTIRQRFFCFAYAGGLLSIIQIVTGWPDLDVGQLMALVAVLHAVEGFLVWAAGDANALPVYLKGQNGTVSGGFFLQMTWPLPLVMLFVMADAASSPQAGFFLFPRWWPIIGTENFSGNHLYLLLPVLAALSYSDKAVHSRVEQKTKHTAWVLFVYSGLLLGITIVTEGCGYWQLLPALAAPAGHEMVFWLGQRQEKMRQACPYGAPEQGIGVLDVRRGSPAARAGLRREDHVLALNGEYIRNRQHFFQMAAALPEFVTVEYQRNGTRRECVMAMRGELQTGILTMPDAACPIYWTIEKDEGIANFLYKKCEKALKKVC